MRGNYKEILIMVWNRPPGLIKVFRTLEMEHKTTGKKGTFIFQEISSNRYDEVINVFFSEFIKEEAIFSSLDVFDDSEAVEIYKQLYRKTLKQGVSVGAFEITEKNQNPKLVGFNILTVVTKDDEKANSEDLNTNVKKYTDFTLDIEENIFRRFVHLGGQYLNGYGLFVHNDYRGWGLGKQILELRNDLGKAYNIPYTLTFFTSTVSQNVAASVGFRDYITMQYEDVVDKDNGEMLFPSLTGKTFKYMIKNLPTYTK